MTAEIKRIGFERTPEKRPHTNVTTGSMLTAMHIGTDEVPFVELGGGDKLTGLQVREEGRCIIEYVYLRGLRPTAIPARYWHTVSDA